VKSFARGISAIFEPAGIEPEIAVASGSQLMQQMYKYPRTPHIEGSRLQPGDEDLDSVPFSAICAKHSAEGIASQYVAVEEKVDGANAAISFSPDGQMLLQSRGHYLTGGEREKHFNLFKQWAKSHAGTFWQVLGGLYIKVEEEAVVTARYKYVRASFSTTVLQSDSHWLNRPIVPNLLRPGVDLFQS
jgi:hypothetical protein